MSKVLGIDAGSFTSPSWLAFLDRDRFTLSMMYLRPGQLELSWLTTGDVVTVAVDAPQGLPGPGRTVRVADRAAGTPTGRLPLCRAEMERGRYDDGKPIMYLPVIRLGVELFWGHRGRIFRGGTANGIVMETYPRAVLKALRVTSIPSKTKQSLEYGSLVMETLARFGLSCPGVEIPTPDQADAMLCAYAARCAVEGRILLHGEPPQSDDSDKVIREGYIVVPKIIQ